MQQKHADHQRHDEHLFDERSAQRVNGALDQTRAVVHRHDLHTIGKTGFEHFQSFFDAIDHIQRVFAIAHDDNATDCDALTIKIGLTAL